MRPRTRGLVLLLLASAVALVAVILLGPGSRPRDDGPVATTSAIGVEYEFAAGEATTWGITLPSVAGNAVATVTKVEPQGVSGLEVFGLRACDIGVPGCAVVNAAGWPLTGVQTVPVEGLSLAPSGTGTVYQLLLGVRRQANADVGSIAAIKLSYTVGSAAYEVTEPWSLRVLAPGTLAGPS